MDSSSFFYFFVLGAARLSLLAAQLTGRTIGCSFGCDVATVFCRYIHFPFFFSVAEKSGAKLTPESQARGSVQKQRKTRSIR
jgi:hypothetical protein